MLGWEVKPGLLLGWPERLTYPVMQVTSVTGYGTKNIAWTELEQWWLPTIDDATSMRVILRLEALSCSLGFRMTAIR